MLDTDSITDLFDAVTNGYLEKVRIIVSERITKQVFQNLQCTLLHQASHNGHCEVLQFLLDNHAFIDCRDANNTTPLMISSQKGDGKSVRLLLKNGADVNASDYDKRTSLYLASYAGFEDCVNAILQDERLDLTVIRIGGWTALHEACRFGYAGITHSLIQCGMDIHAYTVDAQWTPAHMAASNGRLECLKVLIDAGIDINKGGGPTLSSTVLHEACHNGHKEVIQLLLESGADPGLHDGLDLPHHLACRYDRPEALEVLLSFFQKTNRQYLVDAFTNADPVEAQQDYNNAIHMAAYYGRTECLKILLKYNAQNICNGIGRTPEVLAMFKLHEGCLKLLIAHLRKSVGIINQRREIFDHNPLYYLCRNSYKTTEKTIACACLVLNSGLVDINQYSYDQLILETAVQHGAIGLVKYLLESGANPYMCDVEKSIVKNNNLLMCVDFVNEAKTEAKSLMLCSRLKIRKLLMDNGMELAYQLPLPRMLMDYVYHGHFRMKNRTCDA